jgi:hypothetical protein
MDHPGCAQQFIHFQHKSSCLHPIVSYLLVRLPNQLSGVAWGSVGSERSFVWTGGHLQGGYTFLTTVGILIRYIFRSFSLTSNNFIYNPQ